MSDQTNQAAAAAKKKNKRKKKKAAKGEAGAGEQAEKLPKVRGERCVGGI